MLVSDKNSKMSFGALDVNAGSWLEPDRVPGLAHFLEHMEFIASVKYPNTSSLDEILGKNGGYSNAYTTSDHTNFFFKVTPDAFRDVLDIFADLFIEPVFKR